MSRIQRKPGYPIVRQLFHWQSIAGRSVAIICDTPGADCVAGTAAYNHARRRMDSEIARTARLAARPANDSLWRDISTRSAVENQKRIIEVDDHKITERINGHRGFVTDNLRPGPLEDSLGLHVPVRHPVKHENARQNACSAAPFTTLTITERKIYLVVNPINTHFIESGISVTEYLGPRSLNDPKRRFLSGGSSTECQDRLCQGTGHNDFIINFVECQTVHGPAQQCLLSFQCPKSRRILLRQPGEGRNLRMRHSVGHQYLVAFRVISYGLGLAKLQRHLVCGRTTNRAQGRRVSIGR